MDIHTLVETKTTHQVGEIVGFMGLPKGFVLVRFGERLQKVHPTKLVLVPVAT
jgi:hypothetical protein